jgi:hypothetical protein
MEIRKRPPSTLKNVEGAPPGEVLMEIRERPPSTLKNVDGGPPGPRGRVRSPSGIRKVCCKTTWVALIEVTPLTNLILPALISVMSYGP